MPVTISCEKCGHDGPWLQVKADRGRRLGVREVKLQGLSVVPGGWRSVGPEDGFGKNEGFYCPACSSQASPEIAELFEETPNLQGEPLVFVDPEHVDLAAEVEAIKETYKDGVVKVLDSELGRKAKKVAVSTMKWLHPAVVDALGRKFGTAAKDVSLYQHQRQAIETLVREAGSIMLATSTSSGKSLCFQVPWLHDVASAGRGESPTALYLAPLNALIDDQFRSLMKFSCPAPKRSRKSLAEEQELLATLDLGTGTSVQVAQYHGGVPKGDFRREIRRAKPEFVFTNPEMLSRAILAYALDVEAPGVEKKGAGGAWEYFFRRLRYVILDECHELRGVYGSHVANLLRRLRRICTLAGNPEADRIRYVLCSATIREPGKFAERLTGVKPALVIDRKDDGSKRYPKKLVFLRRKDPKQPMKDFARGVLGKVFSNRRLRTIAFQESIPAVEELHDRFAVTLGKDGLPRSCFQVFNAIFLPGEKVGMLEGLRSGTVPGVVSTSALALGIDIGSLSCSVLITYPGHMAKAWQMLGRAGRRGPGLQLYLLGDGYLDRFWEEHPEEFLDQNKHLEELVIMPDNPHILAEHIVAAIFDYPLKPNRDEAFFGESFRAVLREVLDQGHIPEGKGIDEYFEFNDQGRVFRIALRGTGAFKVPVRYSPGGKSILEEDQVRAIRRLYPGAIFVHDAKFYRVVALRYEQEQKGRGHTMLAAEGPEVVIARMPTGSGKSLLYLLPSAEWRRRGEPATSVIVSPIIALQNDQMRKIREHYAVTKLEGAELNSTVAPDKRKTIYRKLLAGKLDALFLSPEKLVDPFFQRILIDSAQHIRLFVVDEAHIVAEWGQDFRTDFFRLGVVRNRLRKQNPGIQTLLLSATLTEDSERIVLQVFHNPKAIVRFDEPSLRTELSIRVVRHSGEADPEATLMRLLCQVPRPCIVYCARKEHVRDLRKKLRETGIRRFMDYMGSTAPDYRPERLEAFHSGDVDFVLATNAFGLGVDKADVRSVIHYDVPRNLDEYYQQIGRAARDHWTGHAFLFDSPASRGRATKDKLAIIKTETAAARAQTMLSRRVDLPADEPGACLLPLHAQPEHVAQASTLNRKWNFAVLNILEQLGDVDVDRAVLRHVWVRKGDKPERLDRHPTLKKALKKAICKKDGAQIDLAAFAIRESLSFSGLEQNLVVAVLDRAVELVRNDKTNKQEREEWVLARRHGSSTWSPQHTLRLEEHRKQRLVLVEKQRKELIQFLAGRSCRMRAFERIYGYNLVEQCGHCDVCDRSLSIKPLR